MNYLLEIIFFTPYLYALPLIISRTMFGVKTDKTSVFSYLFTSGGSILIIFWLFQSVESIPYRLIASFIIMLIMFIINIKTDIMTTVYTFIISAVISLVCEVGNYLISTSIFSNSIVVNLDKTTTLEGNLITFAAAYIIVLAVYMARKNRFSFRLSENRELGLAAIVILFVIGFAVLLVLEVEIFTVLNVDSIDVRRIFVEISIFVLLSILAIVLFIRQTIRERKKNTELLQAQATLVELYDTTRVFHHNFKNNLLTLQGYFLDGNIEKLGDSLVSLNKEYASMNQLENIPDIVKITDGGFRWLLLSKYTKAVGEEIAFTAFITSNLDENLLSKSDLHKVLGILLDNAIEAASQSADKTISFSVTKSQEDVLISIHNSFEGVTEISKVFDKDYTTKKGHSGLGLYSVKKTLNKYDNVYLDVSSHGTVFKVDINIQHGDLIVG